MTTELRETEQKYEARPGMALPSLEDLPRVAEVSGPEDETLTAEYYDTHDLRLAPGGRHAAPPGRWGRRGLAPEAAR